jgi:tRNA (cytidine/uridine-2'-O-)-methyltransferase
MFHVVLFEPEIPPNTGNIMRLCANTGCTLHLIEPLGFSLDEKRLRRAGMDYRDISVVHTHFSLAACLDRLSSESKHPRVFACTTKGSRPHTETRFEAGDIILMGPETRGLPLSVIESVSPEQRIRIPMMTDSRSLNLSNATAVILYEALRQTGFKGLS